jgi:glycopeptide antibiotics resistance protein
MQASMTNGRSGDPFDVLANSIGLFAGFSTFRIFQKKIL